MKILFLVFICFIFLSVNVGVALAAGTWTNTDPLDYSRFYHTATLLPSGNVLVSGGNRGGTPTNKTELYSTASATWSEKGLLSVTRQNHTSNLVAINGGGIRVFVSGGYSSTGITPTSELYNEATGNWSNAASMNQKRYAHTSTLLSNGKVFVTGGIRDAITLAATNSAEIYDPIANTWTIVNPMNVARAYTTSTLLNDGRILVTGGISAGTATSSSELYDSSNGTWSIGPNMTSARDSHTSTLLPNGKVLIVGGTTADLFDPSNNTITAADSPSQNHKLHSATLITLTDSSQGVLIAGSISGGTSSVEYYDYINDNWITETSLNFSRYSHSATLLNNGNILVAGGNTGTQSGLRVEYFTAP